MKIRSLLFMISWMLVINVFGQCPFTTSFTYSYTFNQCSEIQFFDTSDAAANGYTILTWDWDFGDGSPHGNNPTVTHSYVPGSVVNVILTITAQPNGGGTICTDSYSETITVNDLPDAFISSTPNPGCVGETTFFTGTSSGNIQSWDWDLGDGTTSNLKDPSHIYGTSGNYTVNLSVTDVNGCQNSAAPYTQTIGDLPVADFSWDPDPACLNAPVQFTDLSTPTINSWAWDFGDGSTSVIQNPVHAFATTGTFNVTLTVTSTDGCTSSVSHLVDVNPLPTPDFTTDAPVCSGDSVHFTNYSSSPNGPITQWIWNFGDGNTVTIDSPANPNIAHLYAATGTFQVDLTVTDAQGCQNTSSQLVEVVNNPIADFSFDETCYGDPVIFTDMSTANGGPDLFSWNWDFGDPLSGVENTSTLQNPSHIFTDPATYTVTLIVANSLGCTDTVSYDVTVDSIPQVEFTMADDTICLGADAIFTGVGTDFNTWYWEFGDGNTSTQQNPVHTYQLPGSYTIILTASTPEGCISTISHDIKVNELPTANFQSSSPACQNDSIAFTDMSSSPNGPIVQWIWDFSDGTVITIDAPANPNISHLFGSSGNYEVFLTVMDSDSCQNTTSRIVQVTASPIANFSYESACFGYPYLFTDLSSTNGGPDLFSWNWDFDDPPSGANNTSNLQNPSHIFTNPGTYAVSLIVANTVGCSDTVFIDVVVDSLPDIDFTMADDSICLGEEAQFTGTGSNISSWYWDFGDGAGSSNQQNPSYVYASAGTYTVTLTATDVNNCQSAVSHDIVVLDLPDVDFSYNNTCAGDSTYFFDETTVVNGYVVSWNWDFGDGGTSTLQSPTHYYNTFGVYQVTLSVIDNFGCANSYTQIVNVYDTPVAAFSFQTPCTPAGLVNFFDESTMGSSNSPIQSWFWDFGDGYTANERNPVHTYTVVDSCYTVSLMITDANGCVATDTNFNVCVYESLDISFTSTEVCAGQPTFFQASYTPYYDSILVYTWNFNDGSNPVSTYRDTISHVFPGSGNYVVELTALDTNGCSMTIYESTFVNELPSPDFTYVNGTCESPTQFTDQSLGGGTQVVSWSWDFGDYASGTDNFSDEQHPQHTYPPQDSSYQVKLIVTNLNGCVDSIVKTVIQPPCLEAGFDAPQGTLCALSDICFNDISQIYSGNIQISNWFWDFGDGNTYTYDQQQNPVCHSYASGGTYNVRLIITAIANSTTLRDTVTHTITISAAPTANYFVSSTTCMGTLTEFTDISDENGASISSWQWDFGDPGNPVHTSDDQNPSYMFSDYGTYTVELVVANNFGCTDTATQEVEVFDKPDAEFSFENTCLNNAAYFYDHSDEGGANISNWSWNFGDPLSIIDTSNLQNPEYIYTQKGNYDVSLIITDQNECKDTVVHSLEVFDNPTASFDVYDDYDGQQGQLHFANHSEGANAYFWDFGDGQTSVEAEPTIQYDADGTYIITLIAFNENGCSDTTTYEYEMMFKSIYVPNAFVPGNLGWNYEDGRFIVKGVNLYRYRIEVYDAWGDLIWESDALIDGRPAASWNGRNKGNPNLELCPAGAYTWKIDAVFKDGTKWKGSDNGDGNSKPYGTVTLIR